MKYTVISLILLFIFIGCNNYTPEQKEYIAQIEKERIEKDDYMKSDPYSPFNQEPKVKFEPLKYFKIDPNFVFKSKLIEFATKDTVIISGTKGEERIVLKYGFVTFNLNKNEYKMVVYEGTSKSGEKYHSLWFTDLTTNEETYGVGRYLDFELNGDKDFIYTIDFNKAYNPYCAYSSKYSCAIPTKDDFLPIRIEVGEMKFHN
ncbi:MAG: DUF1684 domain-containing protein [Ignavibacteriaceae bacterium]|nr:DUF1684 domain-containing protein [Ignavibacteriaceae bacterium]